MTRNRSKKSDDDQAEDAASTATAQCPQCGAEMVANPLPDERKLVSDMVNRGSHAAYASSKAATMKDKEARLGVVLVCASCRYVTRANEGDVTGAEARA